MKKGHLGMWTLEVGDLSFQELLVRGWKTGRGNPVIEFNLDMNISIGNVRKRLFTSPFTFISAVSQSISTSL